MKVIKICGGILIFILIFMYIIVFTDFGNNITKPYVEKIIKEKSGYDVKFSEFDINFKSLSLKTNINNEIFSNISGKYSIFSQNFDLNYEINIQNLKTFNVNLNENMGLAGKIKGDLKNFSINGVGKMLDSNVRFLANLKDFKPFNIDLDARGLNIAKTLAILNKPAYLTGSINAVANIKNGIGEANITSSNLVANRENLKDINITLPKDMPLNFSSFINLKDDILHARTNLISDIAYIFANDSKFDLNTKNLESDFGVKIDDLKNLEPFVKQKLNGNIDLNGALKFANNKLEFVDFNLFGFGGEIVAHLKNNMLNSDIKGIQISDLMGVISMPKAVLGTINGNIKIDNFYDFDSINGDGILNVDDGKIVAHNFKKLSNLDFPKNNNFAIKSKIKIANGVVNLNSNLNSNLFDISNLNAIYDLKNKNLKANFKANVDDLSKFKELTKQTLNGNLYANGDISMINNAINDLNLDIKTLGGDIKASSNGQNLKAKISHINLNDIFALIGKNSLASGILEADINLNDFKNLNGKMNVNLNNGILNDVELSKILNKDFPKNTKFNAMIDCNLINSVANFNANINSDLANVSKFDGKFEINSGILNAKYIANIGDLSKLAFITGRKMIGFVSLNGDIKKDSTNFILTANSKLLDGEFKANLNNENFNANFDKFNISKLTQMLDFSDFYEGVGDMILNYNTLKQQGFFDITINNGRLKESGLTTVVSLAVQKDITKQIFNDSFVRGNINKGLVKFDSKLKAPKMEINTTKATLNTVTSDINIPIFMQVEKTDLSVNITGTTKNPKYDVRSDYLQKKIYKEIDKGLDKLFNHKKNNANTQNQNLDIEDDLIKDGVKGLIKSLF
ncbi:hypothetical protein F1B92_06325 [Campylobacter sp. FMV-PI01]|uniref:AsmA family protein n=1 Tax=Campylobacter portucalensis TaxID=2608384 RepID=A0A6L5WI31_9BACT|nr:hypothetical protein [Campylobacter portucalensis]MSN96779.1 hypothetical protein [Campylobacter portucalensis]